MGMVMSPWPPTAVQALLWGRSSSPREAVFSWGSQVTARSPLRGVQGAEGRWLGRAGCQACPGGGVGAWEQDLPEAKPQEKSTLGRGTAPADTLGQKEARHFGSRHGHGEGGGGPLCSPVEERIVH